MGDKLGGRKRACSTWLQPSQMERDCWLKREKFKQGGVGKCIQCEGLKLHSFSNLERVRRKICTFHNVFLGHNSCSGVMFYYVLEEKARHPVSHLAHSHISNPNFLTSNEKCNVCDRGALLRTPCGVVISAFCYPPNSTMYHCVTLFSLLCVETSCSNFCPFTRCESLLHNKHRKGVLVYVCVKCGSTLYF